MKILALDLGTTTGYAYNDDDGKFHCGSWLLATDKELVAASKRRINRRQDIRVTALWKMLNVLHIMHRFDVIAFEDVQFQTYTLQCQLWSSFRGAAWTCCIEPPPVYECVPVATLKLFATGNGKATKQMMCDALVKSDDAFIRNDVPECVTFLHYIRDPENKLKDAVRDDNAVDAVWIWKWAKHN